MWACDRRFDWQIRDKVKVQHNQGAMRQRFFLAASPLVSSVFGRRRVGLRPTKHLVAREKKPLVPGVFISQILYFIYWTVLIFILIYFEWRDTENQQWTFVWIFNHVSRVITWFLFNFSYSSKLGQITNLNMTFYIVVPVPYTTPKWLITNWNVTIMGSLEIRAWYQRYMYFFTCQFF